MSITTDTTIPIQYSGVTVSEYGLSKTLDNYTVNEILDFLYCGANNQIVRNFVHRSEGVTLQSTDIEMPFSYSKGAGYYEIDKGLESIYNEPMPMGIIWCESTAAGMSASNLSSFKIVTEMESNKMIVDLPSPNGTNNGATTWTDNDVNKCFSTGDYSVQLKYNFRDNLIALSNVFPYMVFDLGNGEIIIQRLIMQFSTLILRPEAAAGATSLVYIGGYNGLNSNLNGNNSISAVGGNILTMGNPEMLPYNWYYASGYGTSGNPNAWGTASGDCIYHAEGGSNYGAIKGTYRFTWYLNTKDKALLYWAACGVYFRAGGVTYKPIIQSGWVTGYTDNLETPSDLDKWTGGSTKHSVNPSPHPDSQDNEIDVEMSQFAPSVGFVNYIEMDYETAQHVASAFNTYNQSIWNIGGDLFKNLISYKIFAVYGTHSGTIKNIHIAGHELEYNDAPINGNYIDDMGVVDLGTINVGSTFRFNDWRDFAPYTKIECFVPCCGWCQLPPWVMGRTVTGTMYIDIANGSCKAVIKAGKTPVAEIGGCVAVDVPFSSVATGAKAAGLITAITNGAVSAFNPTPQNLISGSFGILSALNANYTETKGVMGDGSNINGCTQFLIKVTRPASTDTGNGQITDRYKHEKGIPCAKTKTLASGQGFTQITDANIDGTMTDREKQMIIDGFRHGLIL